MDIIGLILAIVIGLSLGMIGGGGSILTVPVLVYVLGLDPVLSVSYSLFIVGTTALIGSFEYFRNREIDMKAAFVFSVPSLITVFLARKLVLPAIPEVVFETDGLIISKGTALMLLFALLMLFTSVSMIRQKQVCPDAHQEVQFNYLVIAIEGTIVGLLTGFLGAGGGFLIIPALVLFGKIPMKKAIGTSLFIISLNALTGFTGDIIRGAHVEWSFVLRFSCFAFAGIIIGSYLSRFIQSSKLKQAFGWFTLFMGLFIIMKELFLKY